MKKIIILAALITTFFTSYSQSLSYNDLGILFSKDDNYGTARSNAMSGAFGALGGDNSALAINPAGGAVSIKSDFSVTLGVNNINSDVNYYGSTTQFKDDIFNLSQAGGTFVFKNPYNSNWNRFALSFNYKLKKNFESAFITKGNRGIGKFDRNPNENDKIPYNIGKNQTYDRTASGETSNYSFGISAVHDNKLYVGLSLNFHTLNFKELGKLRELNEDSAGNKLDALNAQESTFNADGFSLGLGFIYKLNHNFRFGLAYETPTWYQEIIEDSNIKNQDANNKFNTGFNGFIDIITTNPDGSGLIDYKTANNFKTYSYGLRTPSRITASSAFVFGKKGLLSIDYTFTNYKGMKFKNGDFNDINQSFSSNYRGSHALRIGSEWRFDKLSVRAGASYKKDPNLILGSNTNKDNVKSFSAGLGYNFGNIKIDLSYQNFENTDFYNLYKDTGDVSLDNNISRITGTITFNL